MADLRAKLNSQRGASFLIAMLFFLICAMIASAIITAATTNSGRTEKLRDEEQAYLAVSSAAQLIRDDLLDLKPFITEKVTTEHTCDICANTETEWVDISSTDDSARLAPLINEAALYVIKNHLSYSKTLTIGTEIPELIDSAVTVTMNMGTDHNMTFVFTLANDTASNYTLKLSVAGTASEEEPAIAYTSEAHEVAGTAADMYLNGDQWVIPETVTRNYRVITTTYKTTVQWTTPGALSKGA